MRQRLLALLLMVLCLPLFVLMYVLIKITSKGPFIFTHLRMGKNRQPFKIYKVRTMIDFADELKEKYIASNEADGPVFKIHNDPRHTTIGRILSHSGLDELPQLINIIKGEMAFIGPRPLPLVEAKKIPEKYKNRFDILPGITSLWVVKGAHRLSFEEWMELDDWYRRHKSLKNDLFIAYATYKLFVSTLLRPFRKLFPSK